MKGGGAHALVLEDRGKLRGSRVIRQKYILPALDTPHFRMVLVHSKVRLFVEFVLYRLLSCTIEGQEIIVLSQITCQTRCSLAIFGHQLFKEMRSNAVDTIIGPSEYHLAK